MRGVIEWYKLVLALILLVVCKKTMIVCFALTGAESKSLNKYIWSALNAVVACFALIEA
jgi:hypothetical protein